jgi:hypothetical protein
MRLITKPAMLRLAVLGLALGAPLLFGWCRFVRMPGRAHAGPLPPPSPAQRALASALRADVEVLAVRFGERNLARPESLSAAAAWIAGRLADLGYAVERDGYRVGDFRCDNLVAERRGSEHARGTVLVGAHYDSAAGSPGANDNATGVAALLALAEAFAQRTPALTLRLVAFVNEEPPYFRTPSMGSAVHAARCHARGDALVAMLSLETLGCYRDAPRSQAYPQPWLSWLYPDAGDFVAFVGDLDSGELVRRCVAAFRAEAAFPSQGAVLPAGLPGVGWSDHGSFRAAGYPALMVTDTAPFRDARYHTADDRIEHVDFDRLARVVEGLEAVVGELLR